MDDHAIVGADASGVIQLGATEPKSYSAMRARKPSGGRSI